jgi:hypothetical protein
MDGTWGKEVDLDKVPLFGQILLYGQGKEAGNGRKKEICNRNRINMGRKECARHKKRTERS